MSLSIMLALGLAVGTANPAPSTQNNVAARTAPADRQLSKAIVAKLTGYRKSGKLSDFDLAIDVESGTVWLKGSVSSAGQRALVRRVVKGVPNVRTVIDDLKVHRRQAAARPEVQLVSNRTPVRSAKRRFTTEPAEIVVPPKPTPAKKAAKGHHSAEHHGEHHHEGEIVYAENWSPDGCECHGNGKLPCAFKSTCDMPQHYPYSAQPAFYYYFRPYQWMHISLQQQEAARYGVNPKNPYDNRFFEAIYKEVDDKIGMQGDPRNHARLRPRRRLAPIINVQPVSRIVYPKVRTSAPVRKLSALKPKQKQQQPALKPLDLGSIDDEPIYRKKPRVDARSVNYLAPKKVSLKKK